jgi:hypothetical protein
MTPAMIGYDLIDSCVASVAPRNRHKITSPIPEVMSRVRALLEGAATEALLDAQGLTPELSRQSLILGNCCSPPSE